MQVSVETLNGLERKLTVSVPVEQFEGEVSQRLKELARKVKIDGFRPGKVPFHVVKARYLHAAEDEAARKLIQDTLFKALEEKNINPAGFPNVDILSSSSDKDLQYTATFEVFPEITIAELGGAEVEQVNSTVADKDLEDMLGKLLDQHKEWSEVKRKSKKGDKAIIDFKGMIDGEAFDGGAAEDFELELGSDSMIPGFEDGIIGQKAGDEFDINVKFPEDYNHEKLAGKDAVFHINLKQVLAGKQPELDDAFAEKFNVTEGVDAFKKDIHENMVRELERRVSSMNKEKAFDKLLEANTFDIPNALIDKEIDTLKQEFAHRIFGHNMPENSALPDFPRELFEDRARKRVHLGLLFSEYVKKHDLKVDEKRVEDMLNLLTAAYEEPEKVRENYRSNKQTMAEIEALVMEEMVAEKIVADAKVKKKKMSYEEVMNPQQSSEEEGA